MSSDIPNYTQDTNLERGMEEIPDGNVDSDEFTGEIPVDDEILADDEIGEDDEIATNDFQNPPSNEHLWDGFHSQWVHQNDIPVENRPQRWHLYKQSMQLQLGIDSVVIPEAYRLTDNQSEMDQSEPGEIVETSSINPTIRESGSSSTAITNDPLIGTQQSTEQFQPDPASCNRLVNVLPILQGDLAKLTTTHELSSLELQGLYKQTLLTLFHANIPDLCYQMVYDVFCQTTNYPNRSSVVQMWNNDWEHAIHQGVDDRNIQSHAYHANLEKVELHALANIMHKYCVITNKGATLGQQLHQSDILNKNTIVNFTQKCIRHNIPMLLRDTLMFDANALTAMQQQARVMRHFNQVSKRDFKPAYEDPCKWPNSHYLDNYVELYPDINAGASDHAAKATINAQNADIAFCQKMD